MEQLMVIFQLRSIKGSYYLNGHYSLHSVFPIIFWSFICGIHPNLVLRPPSTRDTSAPCHHHMPRLHLCRPPPPSPRFRLVALSKSSTCRTSNPTANDTQIALPLPADATRARHLNSCDSNVTHKTHTPPTLLHGSVAGRLPLFFDCIRRQPTTDDGNRANESCFILVLLRFVRPRPSLFLTFADHHILSSLEWRLTAPQPPPQLLTLHTSEALDHPALHSIGLCCLHEVFASAHSRCIPAAASVTRSSRQQY